jgi:hypothetical protein
MDGCSERHSKDVVDTLRWYLPEFRALEPSFFVVPETGKVHEGVDVRDRGQDPVGEAID